MSVLDDLVKSTPKPVLIVGVLLLAILFFIIADPPHTICDVQMDEFKKTQAGFLYSEKTKKRGVLKPTFQEKFEFCRAPGDSPGACYPLLSEIRELVLNMKSVDKACSEELAALPETKQALFSTIDLMAKLSWGGKPPIDTLARRGWLDSSDIKLFCDLQTYVRSLYTAVVFDSFRERVMSEFPGGKELGRKEMWERTIFSETCRDGTI